jgi:hypothetical protein
MANLTQQQILQRLTRLQGPEQEQSVSYSPLSTTVLPSSLKTDRFIWGLLVTFVGRLSVTSGFTPLTNALWNLFQEFRVKGTHSVYGSQVLFRERGATCRDMGAIYGRGGYVPSAWILKGGSVGPFDGTASTAFDVRVEFLLPFPVQGIPLPDQILWGAVKGPDWSGDLHLEWDGVDGTALGSTGANVAISAYGSNSGSAQVLVSTIRPAMTVALQNAISPALTFKSYRDLATVLQGATVTGQKITDLNIGKNTARVILRTGTLQTSVSAGVVVMASLSDNIITRAYPALDGKQIKNPYSNKETKEFENYCLGANQPAGYSVLDWIEGGNIHSMFRSQSLTSSRRFEIDGDVTGASNQGGEEIQEEILGKPVILPVAA